MGTELMRRFDANPSGPYSVDLSALSSPQLSTVGGDLREQIRRQLEAIAELAGLMPPPIPLRGLGPNFDAYSLRVAHFTVLYGVDTVNRRIIFRDLSPRPPALAAP